MDRCFRCDFCDFLANTEKVLESHAALHVKEKLKCDLCGDEFNLSQTLEKHKQYCSGSSESSISASKKKKDVCYLMMHCSIRNTFLLIYVCYSPKLLGTNHKQPL